jgi:hypothetical protein
MRTRDLPGPRPEGVGRWTWWRLRLALWLAEYPMRAAARGLARLPEPYGDMIEPAPALDGCTCDATAGSHRPSCIWAAR